MLCSHAIAPCTTGLLAWGTSAKNWGVPRRSWMTSVKDQVAIRVETMKPELNRMALEVETMARLVHAKGTKIAQDIKASTVLAGLSFWMFAALNALRTSRTFMTLLVVAVVKELWAYKVKVEQKIQESQDEAKKIKLRQLFKIRGRRLKQEGLYALHDFGAWAIYEESVKAAKAEKKKESCRVLGGLVSGRSKRAMATCFERWQGAAAVDAASSEADANDGEDKTAG
ncbi:unnamed protein product [Laminaria digitata]